MSTHYTKAEIIHITDLFFKSGKLSELYNQDFIASFGNTSDTNDAYIEVLAEYLLQRIDSFKSYFNHIDIIKKSSYRTMTHDKEWPDISFKAPKKDEQREADLAKCFFLDSDWDDEIGKMLDYQIPLKDLDNENFIDLMSYNEKQNKIRIIDVVSELSQNNILYSILKLYTFSKMLNYQKFQTDFRIVSNPKLVFTLLINKESPIPGQLELSFINELIKELGIQLEIFVWNYQENNHRKFSITAL